MASDLKGAEPVVASTPAQPSAATPGRGRITRLASAIATSVDAPRDRGRPACRAAPPLGSAAEACSRGSRASAAVVSGPSPALSRCVYEAQKRSCPEQ